MPDKEYENEANYVVDAIINGAYLFDLRLICGGYAYFSTFTGWVTFGDLNRDIRKPDLVNFKFVYDLLQELGHFKSKSFWRKNLVIGSDQMYERWLLRQGWAFVTKKYTESKMSQWLNKRECVRSPYGYFTDIEIIPPSTLKHSVSKGIRKKVLERDGNECLICQATTKLTMQHIIPYSSGGETTSRNLITLCDPCNQKCGNEINLQQFKLAGLPDPLIDISLFKKLPPNKEFTDVYFKTVSVCSNLMQTRCAIW